MSENSQLIVSKRENSGTGHSRSIRQKKKNTRNNWPRKMGQKSLRSYSSLAFKLKMVIYNERILSDVINECDYLS